MRWKLAEQYDVDALDREQIHIEEVDNEVQQRASRRQVFDSFVNRLGRSNPNATVTPWDGDGGGIGQDGTGV